MEISSYTQAIKLARSGNESGFEYLYESTYQNKYYLALQYMKNEESAKDVLQEAYIKAFSKLDKLDDPEAFSSWLGVIVANTAKNVLKKKSPMLFSDLSKQDEEEYPEDQIQDELIQNQPELSYTQKEMQSLVRELIDSLSEEQRICILMFHLEGASIRQIASALECSENTVKSRLNYGRKNLKGKVEELQKKGYKLYSAAPITLLLYLLRVQEADFSTSSLVRTAGEEIFKKVVQSKELSQLITPSTAKGFAKKSINPVTQTAKHSILYSTAIKVVAAVLGVCVVGGAAIFVLFQRSADPTPQQPQQEVSTVQPSESTPSQNQEPSDGQTLKEIYTQVLQAVANQEPGYEFSDMSAPIEKYDYFLYDVNQDGIEELIVGAFFSERTSTYHHFRVFGCEEQDTGYQLKPFSGEAVAESLYTTNDGNGLYKMDLVRGTGKINMYRITFSNDQVSVSNNSEYEFIMTDEEATSFASSHELIEWTSISDLSKLNVLDTMG